MLVTLQNRGYLQQNDDGSYQLARKVLLGKLSERAEKFREIAKHEMQSLASHFNETASLAYLFDDRIQVIESIERSLHDITHLRTVLEGSFRHTAARWEKQLPHFRGVSRWTGYLRPMGSLLERVTR